MTVDHFPSLTDSPTLHATCVVWRGYGVLITGVSGAGKSQLALAMLARHAPKTTARLVGDDRVHVQAVQGRLVAAAPKSLQGKIERFGSSIETHSFVPAAYLDLVVALTEQDKIERLPEPDELFWSYQGIRLPKLVLPHQPLYAIEAIDCTLKRTYFQKNLFKHSVIL